MAPRPDKDHSPTTIFRRTYYHSLLLRQISKSGLPKHDGKALNAQYCIDLNLHSLTPQHQVTRSSQQR